MTALSAQLKSLQIPDALSVLNLQDKRASILFESHEAADIDIDTIFTLGRTGLAELEDLENEFTKFEKNLFSANIKALERTQQPKEFNERLDKKIEEFLFCLSPYFLIKPAQKALEWLIRRFRIHVFNTDALISCILPYHETNLFARVLQIITLNKQTEKWEWLATTQRAGSPLSKLTLIQHCISDNAFLTFICELIPKAMEARKNKSINNLTTLFSFYTSILLSISKSSKNLTESRVGKILPYIYKGLKSDVEGYKVSSYVILSQICLTTTFEEQIVLALVDQVCKSLAGDSVDYGILTLECIYRKQKTKKFPSKSLKKLCESKEDLQQVFNLAEKNALVCLFPAFVAAVINFTLISSQENDDEESKQTVSYDAILVRFLQGINMEVPAARYTLRQFLEQFVKLREVSTDAESLVKTSQRLMQIFEKRYPETTDAVLQDFLQKHRSEREVQFIQSLIQGGLSSNKHNVLPGTETSLVVSLNHPDPAIRMLAVKEIVKRVQSQESTGLEFEFAKTSLTERLKDDETAVVEEVLNAGSVLLKVIGPDSILDIFMTKFRKVKRLERLSLVWHLLTIFNERELSAEGDQNFSSFIYEVIPCMLPSKQHLKTQLPILKVFTKSKLGLGNPFVDGIRTALVQADLSELEIGDSATPLAKINLQIVENVASLLAKDLNSTVIIKPAIHFASSQMADSLFCCFLFGVTFRLLDKVEPSNISPLLELFESHIRTTTDRITDIDGKSKHTQALEKTDIEEAFCDAITSVCSRKMESRKGKDRFPKLNVFCLLLRKIIQKLPSHANGGDSSVHQAKTMLFEVLATGSGRKQQHHPYVKIFRSLLQGFLKTHFPNPKSLLDFLSCIVMSAESFEWLQDGSCDSPTVDVQVCALHIFKVCLETLSKNVESILSFKSEVLPALMILLNHPLRVIREASIGCIQALNDADCGNVDDGLKHLLSCLVNDDTEMIEDAKHILHVLEKLFKPLFHGNADVEMLEPKQVEDLRLLTKYLSGFLLRSDIHLQLGLALVTKAVVFQEFLLHLVPTIEELVTTAQTKGLTVIQFQLLKLLLQKFSPVTVDIFEKCPLSLKIFKTALNLGPIEPGSNLSIQQECLKQVTTGLFSSITSASSKSQIFDALVNSAVGSGSSEVLRTVKQKLIELPIDTADVVSQFQSFNDQCEEAQPKKAKRARRATQLPVLQNGSELIESPGWNKIVILLEVIQQKTNLEITEKLLLAFFGMLSRCFEFNSVNQPSIEYMKQLLLSSLCKCVEEILTQGSKDILSPEKFSVEKVIECFRTSENPQTHHQALLLLGKAASLFPDLVLHNIMTIFTFMGANVLRQDDSYSFEIIKKTIEAVIPTLVTAGSSKHADSLKPTEQPRTDDIVKLVVRVFVDAVPYVPEHRRILLFEHLSTVVGAESSLYIVIAILLEKLIVQMNRKAEGDEQAADGSSLSQDFCLILIRCFSLKAQISTMQNILHYLSSLPDERQEESRSKSITRAARSKQSGEALVPLFDTTKYSTFQIRQFKYHAIGFVSRSLSDKEFLGKASNSDAASMEESYLGLLQEILQFICKIEKKSATETSPASAKYWKVIKHKANEVMVKVQNLLSFDTFVNVTGQVMKHEDAIIRRRAMELIGEKMKSMGQVTQGQDSKLLCLASNLLSLSNTESPEIPINKQVALHTLRPLVQLLSKNYTDEMRDAVPILTKIFSTQDASPQVASSALLCLGELCTALDVTLIQHLPDFMPRVLEILNNRGKDLLLASGLAALRQIVESLSKFMSPYLVQILNILTWSQLSVGTEANKSFSALRSQVKSNVTSLRDEISKQITPRVLLPALDACFDQIFHSEKHSMSSLMEITQIAIESMPRDSIKTNHSKVLSLFLKAFDIRSLNSGKSEQEVENIEGDIIAAFCSLVMKLSENIFRPIFIKILSWSTNDEKPDRLLTFYRLCGAIAEKLKGLFLLFAGQILKPCAELIVKINPSKEGSDVRWVDTEWKSNLLLIYIFDCLHKCFINDATGFLSKERFEYLFTPLVDQLENEMGSSTEYNERVVGHLIPCLSSFAVAVNDESCWKTLNYQVLLKTRSQSAQVRLASLKLLEAVHKEIGESYLILLPETIPFLAELMEDESFEVEKQCQHVISQMEEILGESLQKYF